MNGSIVLLVAILFSADVNGSGDLKPYQEGDKWGFKNTAGKVVVQPTWHEDRLI